jgi:hypothetical protein
MYSTVGKRGKRTAKEEEKSKRSAATQSKIKTEQKKQYG